MLYGLCVVLVIGCGLAWRSPIVTLPAPVMKYGGDAWWSLMVFVGFGFLFPLSSTWSTAALAGLFSCAVETSQLYHAPWIDSIRQTRLGALALGSVFNWPDFPAYGLGIVVGVLVERLVRWRGAKEHATWKTG